MPIRLKVWDPSREKPCSKCHEVRPLEEFSKHPGHRDGRQSYCKACGRAMVAARYQRIGSEAYRRYESSERGRLVRDEYAASDARRNSNNRYQRSEHGKLRTRKYLASLRGKLGGKIRRARRRVRLAMAEGFISEEDFQELLARYPQCAYCGAEFDPSKKEPQLDHVVPISKGGSHALSNAVLACRSCNASKGNKIPHEWF